jgi:hypothetical protein
MNQGVAQEYLISVSKVSIMQQIKSNSFFAKH